MDLSHFVTDAPAARHDGWSPDLKIAFLETLSTKGTVRCACAAAGMSREAAYRLRRRDPVFTRGWNAALALGRRHGEEVLACRPLDGIEEDVWHRGEHVGTRIRHDTRLLLAHLARLDRLVESNPAKADAGRFDELLALVGGADPGEELPLDDDGVPLAREAAIVQAGKDARIGQMYAPNEAYDAESAPAPGEDETFDDERYAVQQQACAEAEYHARCHVALRWDEWFRHACGTVDGVAENAACTLSTLSTSGEEREPYSSKITTQQRKGAIARP